MSYIPATAVTLPLVMTDGGFGKSNSNPATVGGVAYYSATGQISVTNGVTATGRMLQSGNATLPAYSSATYPSGPGTAGTWLRSDGTNWVNTTATIIGTATTGDMLYADTTNQWNRLSKVNSGYLTTSSAGVPQWTTTIIHKGPLVNKTATYTATIADWFITGNTNAFTITLPDCATNAGLTFFIKKIGGDANTVTISRAGSDTIEGATTYALATQYKSVTLVSGGGTIWYIQCAT